MDITKELLEQVAKNARIELSEEEKEEFLSQLKEILDFFEHIKEFETSAEPSFHPLPLQDALREDEPQECLSIEEALSQTEHKKDSYFKGPKIL
ncbi:Asp-tRNA(Asn)/Glu-tRNA(Gln) amidotransferase GatCAB subunit C [Candidatus Woesearchaeota archaeon]|nr:MAG: Asp-tRNA(Asn)/Glu-tRNA(Gln) amidotransferase GatCAB subunit C [Candidatus Woesearchaeota archaeon]